MSLRAFLQVISGARQGDKFEVTRSAPIVIGRKRGDLILEDPLVSSEHCVISWRDDEVLLQDLGSTNGTQVDGRLVREVVLRPGAEIALGGNRLVLFVGDEEPRAAELGDSSAALPQADIAWLLDEELVELPGNARAQPDTIGQELRPPPGLNAHLEVIAGQDAEKNFRFQRGNVTIGRKQGEVPLNDVEVSRNHAVIEVFGRRMIFLRDLGSTNGTYHNGRRVAVAKLQDGDTVGCGKTVMKLHIPSGASS